MRIMKTGLSAAVCAALLTASVTASAAEPEDAIHYRQSALGVMGWHFGPIADMAKGDIEYDGDEFARRAQNVANLASMPWEGFVDGSYQDDGHGVDTDALAKIADNPDDFEQKQQDLIDESQKLATVAEDKDFQTSRAQLSKVGKTCKNCHDDYRAE
ncbi:c-type cytochrome [Halomonas garicola]|uniref:c-type cytochrome n=1 Tax=Halomonas garicola TaxID=1690008 RepID=UPI00289857F3|nr:cytochrome c [Halomonas garicola]